MTSLPSSLRRPRLLLVGCGDIGLRVLRLLQPRWRVFVLSSTPARVPALHAAGAVPLIGDLDDETTLGRLGALAEHVLHLAPPQAEGRIDARTRHLVHALARGGSVRRLVYASTSGVYGDCGGARVPETRALAPTSARAQRRADAEAVLRAYGGSSGVRVCILRVPGIYALDRAGGNPRERLLRGTPVLRPEDDVYTSHIHADDLARACVAALLRGLPQRVVNVCDDTELRMGDYFDLAADLLACARPPRIAREEAQAGLPALSLSFMGESRRLDNTRLRQDLRLRLRYPTVAEGLQPCDRDAAGRPLSDASA
jgi:nucleoside-diphosphate-sugar epimerase